MVALQTTVSDFQYINNGESQTTLKGV